MTERYWKAPALIGAEPLPKDTLKYHIERAAAEQPASEAADGPNAREAHRWLANLHADEAWSIIEREGAANEEMPMA